MPDETPPTPETPAPAYVTKEELAQTAETILSRMQGIFEGMNAQRAEPARTEPEVINLAEIDEAISRGGEGAAAKVASMVDKVATAKVDALRRTAIEPMENFGVANMRNYARDMVFRDMPDRHKRYAKEIDEFMGMIPDKRALANVDAWNHAYTTIIGRHAGELEREAVEAAIRKETERVATEPPASAAAAFFDEERKQPVPTVKDFAGEEGVAALREKRVDGDTLAQRMGYKDWKDYMRVAADYDPARQFDVDNPHELYPNTKKGASHARR